MDGSEDEPRIIDSIPLSEVQSICSLDSGNGSNGKLETTNLGQKKGEPEQKLASFRFSNPGDFHKANMFEIKTAIDGYNSGRAYHLQASSSAQCAEVVAVLASAAAAARKAKEAKTRFEQTQARARAIYRSGPCQSFVALLIVAVRIFQ
jgi:hypothetical protein